MYGFFIAQRNFSRHNDWVTSVLEDFIELEISLEIEDIKVMPKIKFKDFVNETISKAAFNYLMKRRVSRNSDG